MKTNYLPRKLAVILHADVVGSTVLVQKNEILAHERMQTTFRQFSEIIANYGGAAREIRGDALVAEFDRASDAVIAALAYQSINTQQCKQITDDIEPWIRVGISLGEVIIADNTITGVGVVLAQRLEQLADPGKVVVQGAVFDTVPERLSLDFESLGEPLLKGFEKPVRAFLVGLSAGETIPEPEPSLAVNSAAARAQNSTRLTAEAFEVLTGERLELPGKPSIAVLPFQNMNSDPEMEYFADGMSEDIITALSRLPDLIGGKYLHGQG